MYFHYLFKTKKNGSKYPIHIIFSFENRHTVHWALLLLQMRTWRSKTRLAELVRSGGHGRKTKIQYHTRIRYHTRIQPLCPARPTNLFPYFPLMPCEKLIPTHMRCWPPAARPTIPPIQDSAGPSGRATSLPGPRALGLVPATTSATIQMTKTTNPRPPLR